MVRIKKLTLAALVALSLAAGAVAYTPAAQLAGDPSQWGIESVAKRGSFDITESEGQVAGSAGDKSKAGRESS